jgi:hypothetical protein
MLTSLPDPAPGTVRRTLSLEISPDPDWSAGLRVTAFARDLLTRAGGAAGTSAGVPGGSVPGSFTVLRAARMGVTIDTASRVTAIESQLPAALTDPLIGVAAVSGFRARLAALDALDPSSLESAVLDELPTIRLISGYARMIELIELTGADGVAEAAEAVGGAGMTALRSLRDRRSPMVGICAGWAPGATADTRVRAGVPIMKGTPPAPALASMTPYFHAEPAPRPRSMRRRRILDVSAVGSGYEVFEYYRDSHFDSGLREGALHEYEVRARVARGDGDPATGYTLERVDVVPHALPFGECPLAAPHAAGLTGTPLREIAGTVKERLAGTRSCTHLNDTLRFLRYVPALAMPNPNAPNPNAPNPNAPNPNAPNPNAPNPNAPNPNAEAG